VPYCPRHPRRAPPKAAYAFPRPPTSLGALKSSLSSRRVPAQASRRDRPDAPRRTNGPRGVPPYASYHGRGTAVLRQGSRASPIKVLPPLASHAKPPAATYARRRLPPWPSPPSRVPASSRGRATIPTPPLAPTRATLVANCSALPRTSPEQGAQRLASAAAVRPRRRYHCPNPEPKPSQEHP
jgi:hypothetical protein